MKIRFPAIRGTALGIDAYRGFAKLADLAAVSEPDIFDQKKNPRGTQRDLTVPHARQAYEYALEEKLAFWPEVVLCCRDPKVLRFISKNKETNSGFLEINVDKINQLKSRKKIAISRLDGNHRLHFAAGDAKDRAPLKATSSFCILLNLTRDQEIQIFRDINNNQRRMNTSHLDTIAIRLTSEQRLKKENPALYIAKTLAADSESPFFGLVYEGGRKHNSFYVPLSTLRSGVEYLFQRSSKIKQLKDLEAEYLFIRTYWKALKKLHPEAWKTPQKFLLLRGAGLWGASILGGIVIDQCLEKGLYSITDIANILDSGKAWDWGTEGDFKGLSGKLGATEIANQISAEFPTESGVSIRKLAEKIRTKKKA